MTLSDCTKADLFEMVQLLDRYEYSTVEGLLVEMQRRRDERVHARAEELLRVEHEHLAEYNRLMLLYSEIPSTDTLNAAYVELSAAQTASKKWCRLMLPKKEA